MEDFSGEKKRKYFLNIKILEQLFDEQLTKLEDEYFNRQRRDR